MVFFIRDVTGVSDETKGFRFPRHDLPGTAMSDCRSIDPLRPQLISIDGSPIRRVWVCFNCMIGPAAGSKKGSAAWRGATGVINSDINRCRF